MREKNQSFCCIIKTFLMLFITLFIFAIGVVIGGVLPVISFIIGIIAGSVLLVLIVILGIIYHCSCKEKCKNNNYCI